MTPAPDVRNSAALAAPLCENPHSRAPPAPAPRPRLALALLAAAVATVSAFACGEFFAMPARAELDQRTQTSAALHATVLDSEFKRLRAIPAVLAAEPQIAALLRGEASAAAVNARLETLAGSLAVAALYVVDDAGLTRAASNWREPVSFIGRNYAFRGYFQQAMARGAAEEFALGTVSGEPGMYFAQRAPGGAGVVVAKVKFDLLEREWAQSNEIAVAVNETGVVLFTTRPELRFAPLRPPAAGPWTSAEAPIPASQWVLHVFAPIRPATAPLTAAGRLVGGVVSLAALAFLFLLGSRAARKAQLQLTLERSVAERTAELQASKDRLSRAFEERLRAEEQVKRMQDDLVQANKLAMLGQISAGVAHEINQPAAAILSYVKNAQEFLARGELARVSGNLGVIVGLVERIGAITGELRTFARKRAERSETAVQDVLDSALLLMEARMRGQAVQVARRGGGEGARVCVDRIRLEQVIVNLLQNALDAVKDHAAPRIIVETEADAAGVAIAVMDNGPGVPEDIERELFTPFRSTKTSGLGLGLVISRDIVAEFAGSLEYAPPAAGGARFVVRIPRVA